MKLEVSTLWGLRALDEIQLTGDYIDLLEQQLPDLRRSAEKAIRAEASLERAGAEGDDDRLVAFHEEASQLEQLVEILTRPIAYGAFLAVWSMYESIVEEVARRKVGGRVPSGKTNFVQRAKDHFCKHQLQLHPEFDDSAWKHLSSVCAMRNVIAHANGWLGWANSAQGDRVRELIDSSPHLQIAEGHVLISLKFSRELYDTLSTNLRDLVTRVHK